MHRSLEVPHQCAPSPNPAICDHRIPRLAINEYLVEQILVLQVGKVSGASFLSPVRDRLLPARGPGALSSARRVWVPKTHPHS